MWMIYERMEVTIEKIMSNPCKRINKEFSPIKNYDLTFDNENYLEEEEIIILNYFDLYYTDSEDESMDDLEARVFQYCSFARLLSDHIFGWAY